jgi:hypothetical protein
VIADANGRTIASLQLESDTCGFPGVLKWIDERKISVECHLNPSLGEYIELDIVTARTTRDLLGYDFVKSPDGKYVAHVGWIPHFAPPYAKSNYVQLDLTTIYPLPRGAKPVKNRLGSDVVRQRGLTYLGIHEFMPGFSWSSDSRHITFVDCTYDWTANGPASQSAADGKESNRSCAEVEVSVDGRFQRAPVQGEATPK